MGTKYSIPSNYNILTIGSLMGIVRSGKDGDKWIWEPHYTSILASRTFGKIVIAYKDAITQDKVYKLSNYNNTETYLNMPIYDILFGENSLLIYTLDKNGNPSWCAVDETLTKGKFLGDFTITTRSTEKPNYIPIGVSRLLLQNDTGIYHLDLKTYEIRTQKSVYGIKERVEEVVDTHYKFIIDGDKLQCIGLQSNKEVANLLISELQAYKPVIENMVGNFNKVDADIAKKFISIVQKFEVYTQGIVFYILSLYANYNSMASSILDKLNKLDLVLSDNDWFDHGKKLYKLYNFKNLILVLCKVGDKRITTNLSADTESNIFDTNSDKVNNLEIHFITTIEEITDHKELKHYKVPGAIGSRESFSKDIKGHSYEKADIDRIVITNGINIDYAICQNFIYKSNAGKNKDKQNGLVKTNINSIQLLSIYEVTNEEKIVS